MREKHADIWRLKLSLAVKLLVTVGLLVAVQYTAAQSEVAVAAPRKQDSFFDYTCFSNEGDTTKTTLSLKQIPLGLQVTNDVVNQILTRIFAIFIREKLNYQNVSLIPISYNTENNATESELRKLSKQLNYIIEQPGYRDQSMINLAVWMSANGHILIPPEALEAGASTVPGRYGWFVPESQTLYNTSISLSYEVFRDPFSEDYAHYVISDEVLQQLRSTRNYRLDEFLNPLCVNRTCSTLLAEYKSDTAFIVNEIMEMETYLNVLWLGVHFMEKIDWLHQLYDGNATYLGQRFVVLHWIPSYVIHGRIKFTQMVMPKCEEYPSMVDDLCKFELTPLLKYYSNNLKTDNKLLIETLREFRIDAVSLDELLSTVSVYQRRGVQLTAGVYNEIACKWLQKNPDVHRQWAKKEPTIKIAIGCIFPRTVFSSRGTENLGKAVERAINAVNFDKTVLGDYELIMYQNDDQCKSDLAMKALIHYYNIENVFGVLGPACSETVEPVAGMSKHINMAVISYSAEGASFQDRESYPYFFRTIGSNRQYKDFYISFMEEMGWRRVAALTEDGQKYSEYISHMETTMKQYNLELIINKKFLNDVTPAEMNKHLIDLKRRHAKIIIADIKDEYAKMAMCEAYKLEMTAYEGYVWFLPSWISKKWNSMEDHVNISCTSAEIQHAFEGHFTILHRPYGDHDSTMQENITIRQWLNETSGGGNYAGFAYDAVWAYALAADKLFKANKKAITTLRSKDVVKQFVDLIWQTDFKGVSGRVRFGEGGSRITDVDIMQWNEMEFVPIGTFHPALIGMNSSLRTNGGRMVLHKDAIKWLLGRPPGDGTYDCSFSRLAKFLGTDCDNATVVFTALLCVLAVVLISAVSFQFWKLRYNSRMKHTAQIMKNFGIDLYHPSRSKENTLDKWEIPKENVVINRRLGEGAFGTVYGGEAQLDSEGWTAVAVKTLKAGASNDDRLDFLCEAEAMKRLRNKNIIKLLGVCLQSEPIYTIMEFMLYGDLKTYLLARRHMVNDKAADESDISPKRLTMYAMDISQGLAYLAEQKYVHRDIACRNCLVNAQRVVKLGDFGMARATTETRDYYRTTRKSMMPVRWMPPESLSMGLFTPASDVWAFGVVIYEIITFGSFPYQGLTNKQAMDYIMSGKTLQIPVGVKPPLEGLIKACWSQDASKRPTASEIIDYISSYPRLLMPCLDFPGSAVQMPETESDELELLPKERKSSPSKKDSTLDILAETSGASNSSETDDFHGSGMPDAINITMPSESMNGVTLMPAMQMDSFSPITPDGYSVMSPLLMHQISDNSDSSDVRPLNQAAVADTLKQTPF